MLDWLRVSVAKIQALLSVRHLDQEFAEELQTHLAILTEENIRKGMTPEEAVRNARVRLGGLTQLREAHRESRGLPGIETFFQDIRYSLRMLRKNPGINNVPAKDFVFAIGNCPLCHLHARGVTAETRTVATEI